MNENEILDNLNIEDIELEDFTENDTEEVVETTSLVDELDLDIPEDEESKTIDESFDEIVDNLDELISENVQDVEENIDIESEFPDNTSDENIETEAEIKTEDEPESEEEDTSADDLEITEETEEVSMLEKYILDEENEVDELAKNTLEDEYIEEESLILDSEEENLDEEIIPDLSSEDESFITNDLDNINIEFGIEAKGFILSLKMMEAMIEKGYIFKDILNDKIFDAVMIFNGNLENTVMTSDIKIKIEDGKIQLIKG